MAKRNKILISVLVAAVLALLIALCFVGNTFARYTLKQEESVTASIAEWGVTLTQNGGETDEETHVTTNNVGTLKPLAKAYDGETQRNSADSEDEDDVNFVLVATLTNTGAVDATVSVTADTDTDGNIKVTPEYKTFDSSEALLANGSMYEVSSSNVTTEYEKDGNGDDTTTVADYLYTPADDTGYAGDYETKGSDYENQVAKHFNVALRWSNSTIDQDGNPITADTANKFKYEDDTTDDPTLGANVDDGTDTIYIYLEVEWISDLEDSENTGSYLNGDGFDTWCGTWVTGFSFGLTIEAYQAS